MNDGYIKERDEALLSLDKEVIMNFLEKYKLSLVAEDNDLLFWCTVHKTILYINSATEEQKQNSSRWLLEHGFKNYIELEFTKD